MLDPRSSAFILLRCALELQYCIGNVSSDSFIHSFYINMKLLVNYFILIINLNRAGRHSFKMHCNLTECVRG